MKKLVLVAALLLTTILSNAQSKVGTIDAEYILGQMPTITSVEEGLKAYNTELQTELETSIKKYEGLVADYQAKNATFSEEDKKTKEDEIIEVENDIKNFRQKASVLIQMKRNELTQPLYEKIDVAMKQVISEQGYTQIINSSANSLAYSDAKFDITEAVIKKLGITPKQ